MNKQTCYILYSQPLTKYYLDQPYTTEYNYNIIKKNNFPAFLTNVQMASETKYPLLRARIYEQTAGNQ